MAGSELVRQDEQRRAWLESFPEQCVTNCTIARLAVSQMIDGGMDFDSSKAKGCIDGPEIVGGCSTKKVICHHLGSGNTADFDSQIENLISYISK